MSDDKSKSEKKKNKGKHWFVDGEGHPIPERICAAIGAIGLALVVLGAITVWSTGWGKDLFGPGATLLTVALTAWVASRTVVKWAEQRERDRETAEYKHREEVYEALATYMLNRFIDGQDSSPEARKARMVVDAELRTKAALWGSPATVEALAHWQATLSVVLNSHGLRGGGQTALFEDESIALKEAFGSALVAMRTDLASATGQVTLSRDGLLNSIFND